MSSITECTLSDNELIEKCNDWVSKLCKSGGKAWSLQVPVNLNNDPDILFSELGKRFEAALQNKVSDISAKQFLNKKGIFSLDTKKRYNEVIKWMEEYASIVNERKDSAGSWVSVEDRLPDVKKDGNKVLLFREMNESQKALSICVYDTSMIKYCEKSSYWTPLPAPPVPKIQ